MSAWTELVSLLSAWVTESLVRAARESRLFTAAAEC